VAGSTESVHERQGGKTVNGLMIPYVMETKVHGVKQPEKIEIENIAVNPRVEDSRFAKLQ